MLKDSILANEMMKTQLSTQSVLKPKGNRSGRGLAMTLVLTSLVDCFSIIVIYLLVSTSIGGESMDVPKQIHLPTASYSEDLDSKVVVRVEPGNRFLIGNTAYNLESLILRLHDLRGGLKRLTIQADRSLSYAQLNPVILSGLQAGYTEIGFAVVHGEDRL